MYIIHTLRGEKNINPLLLTNKDIFPSFVRKRYLSLFNENTCISLLEKKIYPHGPHTYSPIHPSIFIYLLLYHNCKLNTNYQIILYNRYLIYCINRINK